MRTLHFGVRVADLDRSLAFYAALGYESVGSVPETPIGHLTMLRLPGDEFVTIELVHDPSQPTMHTTGLSHVVVQVESMSGTLAQLADKGIEAEQLTRPDRTDDFLTCRSSIPTATGSSWSSGPPATPTASP